MPTIVSMIIIFVLVLDQFHADIFHDANSHIVGAVAGEHNANQGGVGLLGVNGIPDRIQLFGAIAV